MQELPKLVNFDLDLAKKINKRILGGIDEVGRGCLAGPLVSAIVVFDFDKLKTLYEDQEQKKIIEQINDSKKLSEKKRQMIGEWVLGISEYVHISEIPSTQIDSEGIAKATQSSFLQNYQQAKQNSSLEFTLTDAFPLREVSKDEYLNVISGDSLSFCIASASIVAKNFRDNLMTEFSKKEEFSNYSFNQHKGYGTQKHLEEISAFGISSIHRKSFEPVKSLWIKTIDNTL